jgi:hypothetical protein
MIALAIKLSDQGLGDYWDHVDQIVRNHFIDAQSWSSQCSTMSPSDFPRDPAQKQQWMNLGGWGAGCCVGNSSQALYYTWESIVRGRDGVANINLLMNRASEWLDIDSYLPYEGKVVIHNKKSEIISVRIPNWVDKSKVTCSIDTKTVPNDWVANRLMFANLNKKQKITVEFPLNISTETLHFMDAEYTCRFRGNTLITAAKKGDGAWNPPNREWFKAQKAPLKKITRYVAPVLINW